MKDNENKVLLTSNLYMQISADKNEEISNLKQERETVIANLKRLKDELKAAKEAKKEIKRRIRVLNEKILRSQEKKFVLTIDLKEQKKLANKLNNSIIKDDSYINVNKFYPENEEKKR